jgi:hypothetical protein
VSYSAGRVILGEFQGVSRSETTQRNFIMFIGLAQKGSLGSFIFLLRAMEMKRRDEPER